MDSLAILAKRGWSAKGSSEYSRHYAPRQCCVWTDKGDYDLMEQIAYGVPVEWIMEYHQRSLGGIASRRDAPSRGQAGHDRYVQGIPKPKIKRDYSWSSQSRTRLKYLKSVHMGKKRYERITQQEN